MMLSPLGAFVSGHPDDLSPRYAPDYNDIIMSAHLHTGTSYGKRANNVDKNYYFINLKFKLLAALRWLK